MALRRVGLDAARDGLTELVLAASQGERVLVQRRGRPVAGVVPAGEAKLLERLARVGRLEGLLVEFPEDL